MAISSSEKLSFRAPLDLIKQTTEQTLRHDLYAGVCVALLSLAQGVAYALVAGLPPICGLIGATFGAAVAGLFGSSRYTVMGPTNGVAMLVGLGVSHVINAQFPGLEGAARETAAIQITIFLGFLVVGIQLFATFARLSRLTQFVSHSVVIAYILGIALAMAIRQLPYFFGMEPISMQGPLISHLLYTLGRLGTLDNMTTAIGVVSLLVLFGMDRYSFRVPGVMLTLLLVTAVNRIFSLSLLTVGDVGQVGLTGLPAGELSLLNFEVFNDLLPVAYAITILSILETTSVGRGLAASSGERLNVNQEILGLSLGNLAAVAMGGMPISASTSRSAMNRLCGAATRGSTIIAAAATALLTITGSALILSVPLVALAALLLATAVRMIDGTQLKLCLRATTADAFALVTTVMGCLFLTLDVAFYVGIAVSITLYLLNASRPQLSELGVEGTEGRDPVPGAVDSKPVRVVNVEGEMFFGAANLFQTALRSFSKEKNDTKAIILRLKNARDFDATTCLALKELHLYFLRRGCSLLLCGIKEKDWNVFNRAGLIDAIGMENTFRQDEENSSRSLQLALRRAWKLAGPLPKEGDREKPNPFVLSEILEGQKETV